MHTLTDHDLMRFAINKIKDAKTANLPPSQKLDKIDFWITFSEGIQEFIMHLDALKAQENAHINSVLQKRYEDTLKPS